MSRYFLNRNNKDINLIPLRSLCASLTLEMNMNVKYTTIPNTVGGTQYIHIVFNSRGHKVTKSENHYEEPVELVIVRIIYNTNQIAMYEEVIEKLNTNYPEFTV